MDASPPERSSCDGGERQATSRRGTARPPVTERGPMRLSTIALLTLLLAATGGGSACAQEIPRSQLGSVSQQVAGTRVEVIYRRPVARGRQLFGELVPFGRVWTPSADTVANLRFSG